MQSIAANPTEKAEGNLSNAEYDAYLTRINDRFHTVTFGQPVFTTNADPDELWNAYLNGFDDPVERQYHNCNCCRHFIQRYGALVLLTDENMALSAVWDMNNTPKHYQKAVGNMLKVIAKAKVDGVFFTNEIVLGTYETGVWHHFHLKVPQHMRHTDKLKTPFQAMAEKKEDFKTMITALNEFSPQTVGTALTLLDADALYRSEKVINPAKFLDALHKARAKANGAAKANVLWRGIALAPVGFCHPRSSMVGTLLEDIRAGYAFEDVARRFAAKMPRLGVSSPATATRTGRFTSRPDVEGQMFEYLLDRWD